MQGCLPALRPARPAGLAAWALALALFAAAESPGQVVYTWSSGDILTGVIAPAGVTTLTPLDTLNVQTGADHDFNARALVNNGTVNWTAGNLRSGNGGSFTNNAAWNDSSNTYQFNNAFGGSGTSFINAAGGVYTKTAGVSTLNDGVLFNYGTISVTGGQLNLVGGLLDNGSSIGSSGTGVVQLSAGLLTANGNVNVQNFLLNGGRLAGNQTFAGTLTWLTGDLDTINTTTVGAGSTLTIASGGDHDFNSHALVNNGTVAWTTGNLRSGNGGSITNNAIWNDSSDTYQVNNAFGGSGSSFVNGVTGVYHKSAGVTTLNDGVLVNNGTISVTGGSLNLVGGTFNNGSTIGSSGAGVVQLTNGVLTANGTITVQNFLLNGGRLAGDQTFVGTLSWLNGDLDTANTTTIGGTSTLTVANGIDHDLNAHALVNNGTVNWTAGNLRSGNGGSITNNATWNDSADTYQVNNAFGGSGSSFINAAGGVYNKSAGVTTLNDGVLINNGSISVTGGSLNLVGGTLNNGSTIGSSGPGVVQNINGTLNANGTINVQNFVFNGGRLAGNQTFAGTLSWLNGDLDTPNTTVVGNAATLTVANTIDHDFNTHTVVNNGTVNWTAGNLRSGNGGGITNNATWNDSGDTYQVNNAFGGSGSSFINAATGVYNKSAGVTTLNDGVLVNNGTVSVTGGSLNLVGGTLNNGSSIGSSGPGVVQNINGTLTATGTVNVQNFLFNGGRLAGDQTFAGTVSWLNGDLDTTNTTTIGGASTLTVANGIDHDFNAHTVINNGTVNWTAGNLRSGNGGGITNNGVWNDAADTYQINGAFGGAASTFVNATGGVYNKTAGTSSLQMPLTNAGVINLTGGTLTAAGGVTNTGTVALGTGTVFSSTSPLNFAAGSLLRGAGVLSASAFTTAGTIDPGNLTTAGVLTVTANLSLLATAQAAFELGGTTQGAQYDFLIINGGATLGGNLTVGLINGFDTAVANPMTFDVLSSSGLTGSFANAANGARIPTADGRFTFQVNYGAGSPFGVNDVVISGFQAVPEPATWALLLGGLGALTLVRLRRRG